VVEELGIDIGVDSQKMAIEDTSLEYFIQEFYKRISGIEGI
jgi:hypothetical protein